MVRVDLRHVAVAVFTALAVAPASVRAGALDKPLGRPPPAETLPAEIVVDRAARKVSLPATVVKQGKYLELKGAIEFVLVSEGGKEYESLLVTKLTPLNIHSALLAIGLPKGKPAAQGQLPKGQPVRVFVEYQQQGKALRCPVEEWIYNFKTNRPMSAGPWIFTGSAPARDPATGKSILQASLTRSIIGLHGTDASALLQNPRPEQAQENTYSANLKALPPAGTPVRIVLERVRAPIPPGTQRVQVDVTGRVTGVGFRNYTQYHAGTLGLTGYVRNMAEDKVMAVIEGPKDKVTRLIELMKTGPQAARVAQIQVKELQPEGDYGEFEIQY